MIIFYICRRYAVQSQVVAANVSSPASVISATARPANMDGSHMVSANLP